MNLKSLKTFVEVAEQEHFGRAAESLHMTQSGISQQIKALEKAAGAKLIARTTRSVSLTGAGEIFFQHAKDLLESERLFNQRTSNALTGDEGTVRLGFVASAAFGVVPRLAQIAHEQAPGLKLSLVEMTSEEQITKLLSGDIDVGLLREIQSSPGLRLQQVLQEPLLVAVQSSHRFSNQKSVKLEELAEEGFIMFPRTKVSYLHDHIYRLCGSAGFTPQVVEQAVQFATILGLVSSNAGLAIVPKSLTAIQLPNVVFLSLDHPDAYSRIYVAKRVDDKASPGAKRLAELATENQDQLGIGMFG
jgi:DNA-binding transcriptional LysR family regulator